MKALKWDSLTSPTACSLGHSRVPQLFSLPPLHMRLLTSWSAPHCSVISLFLHFPVPLTSEYPHLSQLKHKQEINNLKHNLKQKL